MRIFTQLTFIIAMLLCFSQAQAQVSSCGPYSSSPAAVIDDNNDPMDDIVVSGTGPDIISDLNVAIQINHTFQGDLDISLTSPSGTTVNIMFDECGGNDDLDITFDDEGVALVCAQPTTGIFIPPSGALSDFDGETFDGTWTLSVVDDAAGDDGTLIQWCLLPTLVAPPACMITDLAAGAQVCDAGTSTYTQEVIVTFNDAPTTGMLDVNGQQFAIGTSPQTVTLTGLAADGTDLDVAAVFTDEPFCDLDAPVLFTAPFGDCSTPPTANCGAYSNSPGSFITNTVPTTDDIVVSGTGPDILSDLNITIAIDHSYLSDMTITLTSPEGTTVTLMTGQCGVNDNMNVEFDDEAGAALACGTPTYGIATPSGALADFDGETFDGTWTLSVTDGFNGDDGTLIQWCLTPTLEVPPACMITDLTAGAQVCDAGTSTYTQEVIVTFNDAPATGMLDLNGQQFAIGTSPQTVTLTGLTADGTGVDVAAVFTDLTLCDLDAPGLFIAPFGDCSTPPTDNCGAYSSSPGSTISDAANVTDDIVVSGTGPNIISDLNVIVAIDYPYIEDLTLNLTSPSGTTIILMNQQCGANVNMNVEFDDQGAAIVCASPTAGTYIPLNALSAFDFETFDGTWTLTVMDNYFLDEGTLVQWCLIPTLVPPPPCAITDLTAGTQSACDPPSNTYTQDITVTFADPPATGMLDVNGQQFAIGTSPQTVTLTGLTADAMAVDVAAFFTDIPICEMTSAALFTAPVDCTPVCSSIFTDTGGDAGDYSADEDETWTLCPDTPGDIITVIFSSFEVEGNNAGACWDALRIYNGPTTASPLMGPAAGYCYESDTDGTTYPGGGLFVPISSTDASGCLTFNFTSDGSVQAAGWEATVECNAPGLTCGDNNVELNATSELNMIPRCMQGAWTYYGAPGMNYFAIEKYPAGGNASSFTAEVDLTVDPAIGSAEDPGLYSATYTMRRYWDVNILQGGLDGAVNVKFFHDPTEVTAVNDAATAFVASNSGSEERGFTWFKTNTGPFDPATGITPAEVTNATTLPESATGTENGITYVQHDGVLSFSGGTGTNGANEVILPSELVAFNGLVERSGNQLTWKTVAEINMSHFELQSSRNGIDFTGIQVVEAKGSPTSMSSYAHLDRLAQNGYTYYRLKQVDEDGSFEFSRIIQVKRTDIGGITLYPNPAKDRITLTFEVAAATDLELRVYDALGRNVIQEIVAVDGTMSRKSLDVSALQTGIYFVEVRGEKIDFRHKFTKID